MKNKAVRNIVGLLFVFIIFGANLIAQDRNEVIKFYNEGAALMKTDVPAAIKAFENVISLSDKVGESAADLKQKAAQVLPGLYLKVASTALSEKKPAPEVLRASKTAVAAAEKYGTAAHKENAGKMLVLAYNNMATGLFTGKEYDKALLTFDSLLAINPGFLNAIYNKALIYRGQNNIPAFEETIDLFLGKLESGKDDAKAKQASSMALEFLRAAGSQANQANKLDEALELLNKASKYGDDKDVFYYFADVYNKQKNFDKGAEYAQKGLDLETGDAEAKAKFYYQLGNAQAGKGQTADACASFKNALYGPFAEAAKALRTNLKCN